MESCGKCQWFSDSLLTFSFTTGIFAQFIYTIYKLPKYYKRWRTVSWHLAVRSYDRKLIKREKITLGKFFLLGIALDLWHPYFKLWALFPIRSNNFSSVDRSTSSRWHVTSGYRREKWD
jgi:hypothetical protein